MSVELIRKPMALNEMTKRETVQLVKERDVIVPDGKPDMKRILQLDGKVDLEQIEVQQDRVLYKGKIDFAILYVPENNSSAVHTMRGSLPLEDFIMLEGITKEQAVNLGYNVEHIAWNVLNERKVNVKVILELELQATKPQEVTVATGIESIYPLQVQKERVQSIKAMPMKEAKIVIKDDLSIPQTKSSIGEILKQDVKIQDEQVKRTDNEMVYNGMLEVVTMYKAQGTDDELELVTHRIPFSGSIDAPKEAGETGWDCALSVEPQYLQVAPDYDGEDRVMETEFAISAEYRTFNTVEEELVGDLYCPGYRIDKKDKVIEYMDLTSKTNLSVPKKEVITLEDVTAEGMDLFSVAVKPMIDEKIVGNDKLTIKGGLEVKSIYLPKEGNNKICTSISMIPFSQEMDAANITKRSFILPKVTAKDVKVLGQSRGEVAVEFILDYNVEVYSRSNLYTIEDLALLPMDKEELSKYPSMTVYVIKKGDAIWNIAKRFNTTVKAIQEVNDLDQNSQLYPGQKIIVLKSGKNK